MTFLILLLFCFLGYKTMTDGGIYTMFFVILSFICFIYFIGQVSQVAEQNMYLMEKNILIDKR